MPFVDTTDETKLFGYTGAQRSRAAWENWRLCWSGAHEYMFKVEDKLEEVTAAAFTPTAKHTPRPRRQQRGGRDAAVVIDEAAVVVDEPVPDWAADEFDVRNWYSPLRDCGCDKAALHAVFGLAQLNEQGLYQAKELVHRVLMNKDIRKPGVWLHKAANAARHDLSKEAAADLGVWRPDQDDDDDRDDSRGSSAKPWKHRRRQ